MRKYFSRRTYILMALFAVLITGSVAVGIKRTSGQQERSGDSQAEERKTVRDAIRRGGYREAARLKGHFRGSFDPHWDWAQLDLDSLAKYSEMVVVGAASRNLGSRLAAQGQLIVTDYEIVPQEILKGSTPQGEAIKVSLPGGLVQFDDGTSAELVTGGFKLEEGKNYIFFLFKDNPESDAFILVAGPQGLFELSADGQSVIPSGRPTDPAVKEVKNKDVKTFLKEVREKSRKWPQPGKCCG